MLFGGAAAHQLKPLKSLQKRAVKLVVKISSTNVFKAACGLPLQSLTDFQRSLQIRKSINTSKHYLHFVLMATIDLEYPFHGWIYTNPIVYLLVPLIMSWNSLPVILRSSMRSISMNNFKRKLGNYLLSKV